MFGGERDLEVYILRANGVRSRVAMNITIAIGVFIFGWLIAAVFENLGKSVRGWLYFAGAILFAGLSQLQDFSFLWLAGLLIYIIGWVDANRVLSRIERVGAAFYKHLQSLGSLDADGLLQKGLLEYKLMREQEKGLRTLKAALDSGGGNAELLSAAGRALEKEGQYADAFHFYRRALPGLADNRRLHRKVTRSLKRLRRRLPEAS